jgi:hypothetical protein
MKKTEKKQIHSLIIASSVSSMETDLNDGNLKGTLKDKLNVENFCYNYQKYKTYKSIQFSEESANFVRKAEEPKVDPRKKSLDSKPKELKIVSFVAFSRGGGTKKSSNSNGSNFGSVVHTKGPQEKSIITQDSMTNKKLSLPSQQNSKSNSSENPLSQPLAGNLMPLTPNENKPKDDPIAPVVQTMQCLNTTEARTRKKQSKIYKDIYKDENFWYLDAETESTTIKKYFEKKVQKRLYDFFNECQLGEHCILFLTGHGDRAGINLILNQKVGSNLSFYQIVELWQNRKAVKNKSAKPTVDENEKGPDSHLLIIVDACYLGRWAYLLETEKEFENVTDISVQASSTKDQTSQDSGGESGAYFLNNFLYINGMKDLVYISDYKKVDRITKKKVDSQTPTFFSRSVDLQNMYNLKVGFSNWEEMEWRVSFNFKGSYVGQEGEIVRGEFKSIQLNGFGGRRYENGRIDKGFFKNDKLHGMGSVEWNGFRCQGTFFKGVLTSNFTAQLSNGVEINDFNVKKNALGKYTVFVDDLVVEEIREFRLRKTDVFFQLIKTRFKTNVIMEGQCRNKKREGINFVFENDLLKFVGMYENGRKVEWIEFTNSNKTVKHVRVFLDKIDFKVKETHSEGQLGLGHPKLIGGNRLQRAVEDGSKNNWLLAHIKDELFWYQWNQIEGSEVYEKGKFRFYGLIQNGQPVGEGKLEFSKGHYYEGGWTNKKPNGKGTYENVAKGIKYVGEWKEGWRHGSGKMFFPTREYYKGTWLNDNAAGKAELHLNDGFIFEGLMMIEEEGDAVEGAPEGADVSILSKTIGFGEWRYSQNSDLSESKGKKQLIPKNFKGGILRGKMHGLCSWKDEEGNRLEGEFFQGLVVAEKQKVVGPDETYEGDVLVEMDMKNLKSESRIKDQSNWISWKKHGKGMLSIKKKGFVEMFEGVFRWDVIDGYGNQKIILTDPDTPFLARSVVGDDRIEGYFYKDKVYTEVSTTFVDGSRYNGYCVLERVQSSFVNFSQKFCHIWSEIKKHGIGTETLSSGESYKGMFINNQREGFGCLTTDNEKYTGEFLNGLRHGRGELVVGFDDETYLGDWQFDKKNGNGLWVKSGEFEYNGDFKDDSMNGTGELKKTKSQMVKGRLTRSNDPNFYYGWVSIEGQGELVVVFDQTDQSFFKADLRRKVGERKNSQDMDLCPLGDTIPFDLEFFKDKEMVKITGLMFKDSFKYHTFLSRGVERRVFRDISEGQKGTYVVIEDGEDQLIEVKVELRDAFCPTFEVSQLTLETYSYKTARRNLEKVTFPFTRSGQQSYSIQFSLTETDTREFLLTSNELDIYNGQFQKDSMSGHGRMEEANGSVYEGKYRNNQRNGKGTLILSDGSQYVGEFANNKYHGEGELKSKNGDLYKGSFENGRKSGFGQLILSNGDSFGGQFRNDMKNGFGRLLLSSGESYEGYFQDDLKEGEGTLVLFNGQKYKGVFLRGFFRTETKKAFYLDGSFYIGECLVDVVVNSPEVQPKKDSLEVVFENQFHRKSKLELMEDFSKLSESTFLQPPELSDPNFVFHSAYGKGKFVLRSGKKFIGVFDDCLMQGSFHGRLSDGSAYKGACFLSRASSSNQSNDEVVDSWKFCCKHGKGKFNDVKGNRFRGTFNYDVMEGDFVINYANDEKYTGHMSGNMRNGKGVMEFKNFDVYEGEFLNDRMHGKGKLTTISGVVYEGQFWEDFIQGHFKVTYANGDAFEGEYFNNKRQGKGKFISAEGESFEGEFHEDKKHGVGTLTMKGQYEYQGSFQMDLKHGDGCLQWANGERYQGNFCMDSIEGKGVLKTNNFMFEGNFKNNQFDKFGKLVSLDETYLGEFKDNQKSGSGILSFINGDVYRGQFSKNLPNGMGEMIFSNQQFKGFFVDGYLQVDKTSIKFQNRTLYEGQCLATPRRPFEKPEKWDFDSNWVFHSKQGRGKLKFPNGYEFEGDFVDDFVFLKNCSIRIGEFMYSGGALYKVKEGKVDSQGTTFNDYFEYQYRHDFGKMTFQPEIKALFRQRKIEEIMDKECIMLMSPLVNSSDIVLNSTHDTSPAELNQEGDLKKDFEEKWTFENLSSFEGNFKLNKINGSGKAIYKNNDIYEGNFVDNLRHGQGKFQTSSGLIYEGSFEKNHKAGKGVLKVPGSFEYEGEFKDDLMCGKGVWVDSSNNRYKGSFREGLKSGFGSMNYSNGDVYEGQFHKGLRNGKGKLTLANGEIYEGLFLNDKKHGKGVYWYSKDFSTKMDFYADFLMMSVKKINLSKGCSYMGECLGVRTNKSYQKGLSNEELWTFHKKHGKGLLILADKTRVSGEFKEDMCHGKVVTIYSNKNQFELTYLDDKPVDVGIYKTTKGKYFEFKFEEGMVKNTVENKLLSKGETYTGEILMRLKDQLNLNEVNSVSDLLEFNCLNGKGVVSYPDGTVFRGFFNQSKRVGSGVTTFSNGDLMIGKYLNDSLKGPVEIKYKNGNRYEGILTIDSEVSFKKVRERGASEERENEITKYKVGEGKFTSSNGHSLVGHFEDNCRHGVFTFLEKPDDDKKNLKKEIRRKKETPSKDSKKIKGRKNLGLKYFRDELL